MNYSNKIGKIILKYYIYVVVLWYFSVRITTSVYPVPAICRFDQLGDWFESLADILHWNLRKSQLNFDTNPLIQNNEQIKPDETKGTPQSN